MNDELYDYWVAKTDLADDRGRIFSTERAAEDFIQQHGAGGWAKRRKGTIRTGGAFGGYVTSQPWMEWDRGVEDDELPDPLDGGVA